jgi:hypothetical protein
MNTCAATRRLSGELRKLERRLVVIPAVKIRKPDEIHVAPVPRSSISRQLSEKYSYQRCSSQSERHGAPCSGRVGRPGVLRGLPDGVPEPHAPGLDVHAEVKPENVGKARQRLERGRMVAGFKAGNIRLPHT